MSLPRFKSDIWISFGHPWNKFSDLFYQYSKDIQRISVCRLGRCWGLWKFQQKKQTKCRARVSVPEKEKTRISNAESLDRLINLEDKKEKFDEQLLETLKDQQESRKKKDDAMIAAAKSFQDVSAAIIASLSQR